MTVEMTAWNVRLSYVSAYVEGGQLEKACAFYRGDAFGSSSVRLWQKGRFAALALLCGAQAFMGFLEGEDSEAPFALTVRGKNGQPDSDHMFKRGKEAKAALDYVISEARMEGGITIQRAKKAAKVKEAAQ